LEGFDAILDSQGALRDCNMTVNASQKTQDGTEMLAIYYPRKCMQFRITLVGECKMWNGKILLCHLGGKFEKKSCEFSGVFVDI
jgi:nitrogen fixation protein